VKASAQRGIYYGWVIVLVSFLTMLLVMGTRFSFGVFYSSMLAEMGWSRAATAGIFSVSMLVYAAVASGVGAAFDWWGPRRMFPVAAVLLTDWDRTWGCDPIVLPGLGPALSSVWRRALDLFERLQLPSVEVGARDDDTELVSLLTAAGFSATDERSGITWMHAADRPAGAAAPEGFRLVDRADGAGRPHPMRARSGDDIEVRLRECSLYDPALDLAVQTVDGELAAYALFWNDTVTGVGLVEPMRTEDAYQRRGLARMLLAAGLDRLAARGAQRFKVGYATEIARHLYTSVGFRVDVTTRAYTSRP